MRACAIGRESAQQSNSFYDVHLGTASQAKLVWSTIFFQETLEPGKKIMEKSIGVPVVIFCAGVQRERQD